MKPKIRVILEVEDANTREKLGEISVVVSRGIAEVARAEERARATILRPGESLGSHVKTAEVKE